MNNRRAVQQMAPNSKRDVRKVNFNKIEIMNKSILFPAAVILLGMLLGQTVYGENPGGVVRN